MVRVADTIFRNHGFHPMVSSPTTLPVLPGTHVYVAVPPWELTSATRLAESLGVGLGGTIHVTKRERGSA